jgi:hypothetical protein
MYVTKVEFAKEVGLHRTTIAHYIRKGKLKGCLKGDLIHLEKGKAAIVANVAPIQQKNINVRWEKKRTFILPVKPLPNMAAIAQAGRLLSRNHSGS